VRSLFSIYSVSWVIGLTSYKGYVDKERTFIILGKFHKNATLFFYHDYALFFFAPHEMEA
jgi:hypothetical protein